MPAALRIGWGMDDEATRRGRSCSSGRRMGSGGIGGRHQQRVTTQVWSTMMTTMPLPPQCCQQRWSFLIWVCKYCSGLNRKRTWRLHSDTTRSRLWSSPSVISSSSWYCLPFSCPPLSVLTKTRRTWGKKDSSCYPMVEAGEEKLRGLRCQAAEEEDM